MPKIPKETRWTRFKLFLRGVLLYNTVYWNRASDGLRPPRSTRDERREKRPKRDFAIIKPRENPRAKQEADEKEAEQEAISAAAAVVPEPARVAAPLPQVYSASRAEVEGTGEVRKRRKRRKLKRSTVMPHIQHNTGVADMILKKLFGRKE